MSKKVLIACEESQTVCKAFRKLGIEAYSCDVLDCSGGHPEWHIKGDVLNYLNGMPTMCADGGVDFKWDLMIAHPPCTYLAVSANKWYKDQPPRKSGALVGAKRRAAREMAIEFFMDIVHAPIEKTAIENPIGVISTRYRKPDQVIQPWMFGHGETKATCLWLKGLPNLTPTDIVEGREQRLHYLPKTKDRARLRSITYQGIANAMAEQWGPLL